MAFVPENPLEEALVRAAADPQAAPAFFRLLMESQLIAIGSVGGHGGGTVALRPGDTVSLANVRHNGRNYHPVFSSMTRLQHFVREATGYFAIDARALFGMTTGSNFVLNPGAECGKELMAGEIAFWLDPAPRETVIDRATGVLIGQPAVYPQKLVEALCVLFANRSDVASACLVQIAFHDRDEPPHPLIAIEIEGSWKKIAAEVSELAAAIVPDTLFDLMPLKRGESDGIQAALQDIPPFYSRRAKLH